MILTAPPRETASHPWLCIRDHAQLARQKVGEVRLKDSLFVNQRGWGAFSLPTLLLSKT